MDNIASIRRHTATLDLAGYRGSEITMDAVERCLSRISEAAVKLGPTAEGVAPGADWPNVRGLGNILRHEYDGVSPETIWAIVTNDLEVLAVACRAGLDALPPDPA